MPPERRNCFPAPGPGVKLSANAAQMEAVTQAAGCLEELPGRRRPGRRSGRGETRRQEAQALRQVWRTQALDALEALEKTLAGEEDAFCRRVTEALAELCDDLTAAAEAAGESGLSSPLRRGRRGGRMGLRAAGQRYEPVNLKFTVKMNAPSRL